LGAFLEVLDTSIANVALPYMAGNLGASNDQSTGVTSYVVSNAIICNQWLARGRFGTQTLFQFLSRRVYSEFFWLCGIGPVLGFLLLFRVLQGAVRRSGSRCSGDFADTFPPQQRGLAFALLWHHGHHGAHDRPLGDGSPSTILGDDFFHNFRLG